MCVSVFPACISVYQIVQSPQTPEDGIEFPGNGVVSCHVGAGTEARHSEED